MALKTEFGRTTLLGVSFAVAALFALMAAPVAVAASGPWVQPVASLSETGQHALDPRVAVGPDGTTTAVWRRFDGQHWRIQAATRPPGGSFSAAGNLSAPGGNAFAPQIVAAADGTTTVAWERVNGSGNSIVQTSTRTAGGAFGAAADLSAAGQNALGPRAAVAADGAVTVVWHRTGGGGDSVQASTRAAGGTFGPPLDLSADGLAVQSPAVAVAPEGATAVVWTRTAGPAQVVQTAIRAPGGAFAAAVDVSANGFTINGPDVAVASDGDVTVVWQQQSGLVFRVQASTRPASGSFGAPQPLSPALFSATGARVVAAADGTETVVWDLADGATRLVQTSTRPHGGGFAGPVDVSGAGVATTAQLAVSRDGTTDVVWVRNLGGPTGDDLIQVATRPPDGNYVPAVDLSPADGNAIDPAVALGPDGNLTVVWVALIGGYNTIQARTSGAPPPAPPPPRVIPVAPVSIPPGGNPADTPPKPLARARVTGSAKVGKTLTCTRRRFANATRTRVRWLRGGWPIRGATHATYKVQRRDRGKLVTCEVRASGPGGSATMVSRGVRVSR